MGKVGTVSWLALVQAVSSDVVARLATAGLPPLVDGQVFIGPEHEWENSAPPRIVMVPTGSEFLARQDAPRGGRDTRNPKAPGAGVLFATMAAKGLGYTVATVTFAAPPTGIRATGVAVLSGGSVVQVRMTNPGSGYITPPTVTVSGDGAGATAVATLQPDAEKLSEISTRALWSEKKRFRVTIWGCTYVGGASASNPDSDWDFTELTYQVFIQSLQGLMAGCYKISKGVWISSLPGATKLDMLGRMYAFELEIATPVPDTSLLFVPVGTLAKPTVQFQPQDGSLPEAI